MRKRKLLKEYAIENNLLQRRIVEQQDRIAELENWLWIATRHKSELYSIRMSFQRLLKDDKKLPIENIRL